MPVTNDARAAATEARPGLPGPAGARSRVVLLNKLELDEREGLARASLWQQKAEQP